MKKVFSCLIILFFTLDSAFSQTEVEGTFFSDVIWTAAESPYHIVGNVQMGGGAILTIEPGVVVKFTGAYEILIVDGIQVNGTAEDSVIIEPLEEAPLETTFIRLINSDLSNSQITYSRIEGADNLILIDDECDQTLEISNSLFKNGGFRNGDSNIGNEGTVWVGDCIFRNVTMTCRSRGEILISSSDLYDSVIESHSSSYNLQVIGIVVDSSNLFNSILKGRSTDRSLLLKNSYIYECNLSANYNHPILIQNCKIMNSSFNRDYVEFSDDVEYFELTNCILRNTSLESRTTNSENSWHASMDMENCIVVKGSYTEFGCMEFNFINSTLIGDSLSLGVLMERGEIFNSTIVQNDLGLRIIDSGIYTSIEGSNLFRNLTFNIELENVSYSISAIGGYWGSSDPYEIADLIYDVYDDTSLGMVIFNDFLNEPNIDCPVSPPFGLSSQSTEQGFMLSWNANPESDIAGDRLHYGNFDGFEFENIMDMGSDTAFIVPYFVDTDSLAITAYDNQFSADSTVFNMMTSGHESWYSSIITTNVLTGFAESQSANDQGVIIFPNPVKSVLMIELGDSKKMVPDFRIFDLKGRIVLQGSLNNTSQINIDVSSLSNGSYLIELVFDSKVSASKFVKM